MKKYWTIIKTEWQRQITYRLNFIGYRFGNIVEIVAQLIIWTVIYKHNEIVRGYTYHEMTTYILIGWLVMYLTSTFGLEVKISYEIKAGMISNFLTKPISYIRYIAVLSVGRVSVAMLTALIIQGLIIIVLNDLLLSPNSFNSVMILLTMILIGFIIQIFISILLGFIAFWTVEVDGVYYFFFVLTSFLSGTLFPLDLLPASFVKASYLFPFVYTFYAPAQVYLGKISAQTAFFGIIVELIWVLILYGVIKLTWKKGLKKYESVGI